MFERSELSVSCEDKEFECPDLENYVSYITACFFVQYIDQPDACPPARKWCLFLAYYDAACFVDAFGRYYAADAGYRVDV